MSGFVDIFTGTVADDGTGDDARAAGAIINQNFVKAMLKAIQQGTTITDATANATSAAHAYKTTDVNRSTDVTITFAEDAVAVGEWGYYYQVGDGQIILAEGTNVTISDENKSAGKGFMLFWWCNSANNIRTIGGVE